MIVRLLVAVNEGAQRERIRHLVEGRDTVVEVCAGGDLPRALAARPVDVVLLGRSALGESPAREIAAIRELPGGPDVVLLLNRDADEERVRLLAAGCTAALYTGLDDDALRDVFGALIERRRARAHRAGDAPSLESFVAVSYATQLLLAMARDVAALDAPILLLAEKGARTDLLAHAIHAASPRADGPFVSAPAAQGRSGALLGRALVGHPDGGRPRVTRAERGLVELAHRGTLYLDELIALPLDAQRALVTILREGVLTLGAEERVRRVPVDVRLVATTRVDPEETLANGRLDRELFDRVRGVVLEVPPLRSRRDDVPALAEQCLTRAADRLDGARPALSPAALEALVIYPWPGNDEELEAVMMRAALLAGGAGVVTPAELRLDVGAATSHPTPTQLSDALLDAPLKDAKRLVIDRFEREYLAAHLDATHGRVGTTASRAGITPRALYEKMRALGLRKEDFRER